MISSGFELRYQVNLAIILEQGLCVNTRCFNEIPKRLLTFKVDTFFFKILMQKRRIKICIKFTNRQGV